MKSKNTQKWVPLYVDKWIFGSTRIELEPDERGVFVDLICLGAKDNGYIRANEEIGYLPRQLAGLLNISEELLNRTIQKCIKYGKLEDKGNGIYYLKNWDKYQFSRYYKWLLEQEEKEQEDEKVDKIVNSTLQNCKVTLQNCKHSLQNCKTILDNTIQDNIIQDNIIQDNIVQDNITQDNINNNIIAQNESLKNFPSVPLDNSNNNNIEVKSKSKIFEKKTVLYGLKDEEIIFEIELKDGVAKLGKSIVSKFQDTYKGIDVISEIKKAITWMDANPGRRKTTRGVLRYLNSWLSRANDRIIRRQNNNNGNKLSNTLSDEKKQAWLKQLQERGLK